ncbi:MAG: MBOAT family protein [Acidimicrobiia bacterium]|nr:MBOAT family protein [Acidimicrobiia bacterium]MBP8181345.1 MBOAT family protein [Acidimicrobiia bacterium]
MEFNSREFLFFLPIAAGVVHLCPAKLRISLALVLSWLFYSWGHPRFLIPLLLVTLLTQGVLEIMWRRPALRRTALVLGLCGSGFIIGLYKIPWLTKGFAESLQTTGDHTVTLLPLGLTFYAFQSVSLMFEVKRNHWRKRLTLIDTALYLSFFPQLLAGPIVRPQELVPELRNRLGRPTRFDLLLGVEFLLTGLFKKVVLADTAWRVIDSNLESGWHIAAFVLMIPIYSYADVAGYNDMAKGSAAWLGVTLPENFREPVTRTRSWADFWKRHHITVMRWMRDYVYLPVRGRGKSRRPQWLATVVTLALMGLWHGFDPVWVLFGGGIGLLMVVEVAFIRWRGQRREASPRARRITDRKRSALPAPVRVAVVSWERCRGPLWVYGSAIALGALVIAATGVSLFPRSGTNRVSAGDGLLLAAASFLVVAALDRRRIMTRSGLKDFEPTVVKALVAGAMTVAIIVFAPQPSPTFIYLTV